MLTDLLHPYFPLYVFFYFLKWAIFCSYRIGGAALAIAAASYAYTIEPVAGAVVFVVLAAGLAAAYFISTQQKVVSSFSFPCEPNVHEVWIEKKTLLCRIGD